MQRTLNVLQDREWPCPQLPYRESKRHSPNVTQRYAKSFFPYCQSHWDGLDESIKEAPTLPRFKSALLKNIRPLPKPYFNANDKNGMRRIAQLRVGLSDLRAHRNNHHFVNCPSATCVCALGDETTEHFLLGCNRFDSQRTILFSSLANISPAIDFTDTHALSHLLLYGSKDLSFYANTDILNATIAFISSSKRFEKLEAFQGV